jgi:hypothetical protein
MRARQTRDTVFAKHKREGELANFKRFDRASGGDVYVNVELVTYVSLGRAGGTTIHFDRENNVVVHGQPRDVLDQLWPVVEQERGAASSRSSSKND